MDNYHTEKKEIMRKYLGDIANGYVTHIGDEIPSKKIDAAKRKFASGIAEKTIIGFYDTSLFANGESGYVFTEDEVYCFEFLEKQNKMRYNDIKYFELAKKYNKDCDRELYITLLNDSTIEFTSSLLNKTALMNFLKEMKDFSVSRGKEQQKIAYKEGHYYGAEAGGHEIGGFQNVNKLFDEEKFHARQGHGFAAERANNLYDKLQGRDAKIIGDGNEKNGADRIVDGVKIQSKYCATGSKCVNECFEDGGKGAFRYMDNGKPILT